MMTLARKVFLPLLLLITIPFGYSNFDQEKDEAVPMSVMLNSDEMKIAYNSRRESGYLRAQSEINWSNVVVIIPTFNGEKSNILLKSILKTWITRLGEGADVLLVTDKDDDRTNIEIVPPEYRNAIKAKVHIYKSPVQEGNRMRYKIIESFKHAAQMFMGDRNKQIFLKINADSYVIAEHVLEMIQSIHYQTNPTPVLFGNVACNPTCHASGGMLHF